MQEGRQQTPQPKTHQWVILFRIVSASKIDVLCKKSADLDECFHLFVSEGFQSLIGNTDYQKPVRIQRDTGVSEHYIYSVFLPLNADTSCTARNTVLGIEMGYVPATLHLVFIGFFYCNL